MQVTFSWVIRRGANASSSSARLCIEKQMGTSEKMIEKDYGHNVVEDYRHELGG